MAALIRSDEMPGLRDAALLSPVDSRNILSDIVPGGEIRNARARIRQLRNKVLLGRDVVGAVAELQRIIAAARAHGSYRVSSSPPAAGNGDSVGGRFGFEGRTGC